MKKKTGIGILVVIVIVVICGVSIEMIHQNTVKKDRANINNEIQKNNEIVKTTAFKSGKEELVNINMTNATTEQKAEVNSINETGTKEKQAYANMIKEQQKEQEIKKEKESLKSITYLNYLGPIKLTDYSLVSKGKLVKLCDQGVLNIDNEYMGGIHKYDSNDPKGCIESIKKQYEILEAENTWLEPIVNYVSPKERSDAFNKTQKEYKAIQDGLKKELTNNYNEAEYNTYYKLWDNATGREVDTVQFYLGVEWYGNTPSPIIIPKQTSTIINNL